eukprot:1373230-Prymnesium_polylepis.1
MALPERVTLALESEVLDRAPVDIIRLVGFDEATTRVLVRAPPVPLLPVRAPTRAHVKLTVEALKVHPVASIALRLRIGCVVRVRVRVRSRGGGRNRGDEGKEHRSSRKTGTTRTGTPI